MLVAAGETTWAAGPLLKGSNLSTGCSGLAYKLEYADQIRPEDHRFDSHGITVVVDPLERFAGPVAPERFAVLQALLAYLLAGVLIGPQIGLGLISEEESIRTVSEVGLILRTERSVLFVIPWGRHWIIGTTDTDWYLDKAHPAASRRPLRPI